MKISDAKTNRIDKPFYKDSDLELITKTEEEKISGFVATYKGVKKEFKVIDFNVLAAFQKLEQWLAQQK